MPVNKHALIRYRTLDKCFSNFARRYYIEDLIQACNDALYQHTGNDKYSDPLNPGISRRQVLVDIDFMESDAGWGAMIERVKDGRRVYYRYEDPEYTINNQPITDEEMAKLRETMLMLSRFKGLPQFEWMESLLTNLEDKFHLQGTAESVISMDGNAFATGIEHLSPLFNAILNKTPLLIDYETFDGTQYHWEIHPYHIKQYNNRWFLIGLNNNEYQNITNLALDRIVSFEQVSTPFIENTIIEDFDDYFYDIVGVSFPPEGKVEKVLLQFSKRRFPYIVSKPIHGSQKTISPNEGLISLDVIPNRELESIILSFGDDVEVLTPASLRDAIATKIKNSITKYELIQNDCTNNSYLCSGESDTISSESFRQVEIINSTGADTLHR